MKREEIISVLKDLYDATGFRMSLHDKDFQEIAAFPESRLPFCALLHKNREEYEKCLQCDGDACREAQGRRSAIIYKCRYGLTEAISPLYNFGTLTGFLMMGQVADEKLDLTALAEKIIPLAESPEAALEALNSVPKVSSKMTETYVRIMTLCARFLTLSNAISSKKPSIGEATKKYISENYAKKISINDICRELGCSKSTLLTTFKKQYGLTVGDFLTDFRLGEAMRLLEEGELSINEIAHETGFYDQSYFSKVFSAKCGVSPSEYRKSKLSS